MTEHNVEKVARCIWVLDSTGREWWSDPDTDGELTPEAVEEVVDVLSRLREVNTFNLIIGGVRHYFHPDHIVAWAIREPSIPSDKSNDT